MRNRGVMTYDPQGDLDAQAKEAAAVIAKKLGES
jgi:hypothetical protein